MAEKKTKIRYDNDQDEMNTNNDQVKWRRFIVPKKVEQINDRLFIDTSQITHKLA